MYRYIIDIADFFTGPNQYAVWYRWTKFDSTSSVFTTRDEARWQPPSLSASALNADWKTSSKSTQVEQTPPTQSTKRWSKRWQKPDIADKTPKYVADLDELKDTDYLLTMGCSITKFNPAQYGVESHEWEFMNPDG